MKKRLFMLLGAFLLAVAVPVLISAQQVNSDPEYNFVVWLHDGGKVSFPLEAHPKVTHSDGTLVVSSEESRVEYAHSSVRKFTIEEVSGEVSGVGVAEREAQWHRQGDAMVFSDCTSGESVAIYDAKGHLLQRHTIASDGTLQIPLHSFVEGMYIVKTENITYKFIKK